ncbi:MAG: hypothetical protein IKO76_04765 [Butyrivibrio sp.]|nr:hypothetical protein [Butyrivibrio sp.]
MLQKRGWKEGGCWDV